MDSGILNDIDCSTPMFARISTVQGSRGSQDTVRDIVGNSIPVLFIQDSIKFPDFVHAVKLEPHNEIPQYQTALGLHVLALGGYAYGHVGDESDMAIPRSFE